MPPPKLKSRKKPLKIILDSNALFVPLQFKIDIFEEIKKLLNMKFELIILPPILRELEELAENMKEVRFVKINVEENQELSSKYNISGIPCLVVFKSGKEIGRIIGSQTAEKIEEKIKGYL